MMRLIGCLLAIIVTSYSSLGESEVIDGLRSRLSVMDSPVYFKKYIQGEVNRNSLVLTATADIRELKDFLNSGAFTGERTKIRTEGLQLLILCNERFPSDLVRFEEFAYEVVVSSKPSYLNVRIIKSNKVSEPVAIFIDSAGQAKMFDLEVDKDRANWRPATKLLR